jgi:hypothetical protein
MKSSKTNFWQLEFFITCAIDIIIFIFAFSHPYLKSIQYLTVKS